MLQLGVFLLICTAVSVAGWWLGQRAGADLPFGRLWLRVVALLALMWVVIAPFFVLVLAAVAIAGRLLVMPALVALGWMAPATLAHDNMALAGVLGAVPLVLGLLLVFRRRVWRGCRWARVGWRRYRRRSRRVS